MASRSHRPTLSFRDVWAAAVLAALANGDAAAEGEAPLPLEPIVVTGKRASLATALQTKREKAEIVDAVAAEDIQKLPDLNVGDALQRITGVQIARDRGESSIAAIRGLGQIETTLNGREVFTAGTGRLLDLADFPAEMLSGIHVYKTSSADQLEGGIGGTVDLRTRRPLDLRETEVAGSARYIQGDLVKQGKGQYSFLASKRWKQEGGGEFGALVNFAYQERAWREDQKSAGNPTARTDIIPGTTVIAPNGTTESASLGLRQRTAGGLTLQWRPTPRVELYAEANYAELKTRQDTYQISIPASGTFIPGSAALFPGTNDLQSITWTNPTASLFGFARDTVDRNSQFALGGKWNEGNLTLKTDLSRTESHNNLFFAGLTASAAIPRFTQDLSGQVPSTRIDGVNLLDPASTKLASFAYRVRPYDGDLTAFRVDGDYWLAASGLESISVGLRLAERRANNGAGLVYGDAAVPGTPVGTAFPGLLQPNPATNFFPGSTSIGSFLTGNPGAARDWSSYRAALGITSPLPAGDPLGTWSINERTTSAYAKANFRGAELPLEGNAGLRLVQTRERVLGNAAVPATGGITPIAVDTTYNDLLPSANLRYEPRSGTVLRAALSRTVTRPDFSQLSPSVNLVRNTVTPALNTGSAGNPDLRPVRSDNLDIALERYFSDTGAVHLTAFAKQVDGFALTTSTAETWYGETYQVKRPYNANSADVLGAELGYQQFYDFLPGWLKGLGMQANYTYVDSSTLDPVLKRKTPLQNLSRHSTNLVGMYERGPVSARVAWNWRDRFLSRTASFAGVGTLPVYTRAYGWLDASVTYRLTEKVSVSLEGLNLTRTVRRSYYGTESRPESAWMNDTQIACSVAFKL